MSTKEETKTEYAPFRPFEFAQNVRHEYSEEHIGEILSEFSEEELRAQSESLQHLYDAEQPEPAPEVTEEAPSPEVTEPAPEQAPEITEEAPEPEVADEQPEPAPEVTEEAAP